MIFIDIVILLGMVTVLIIAALDSLGAKSICQIKWASSSECSHLACVENRVIIVSTRFTRALLASAEKVRAFTEYQGLRRITECNSWSCPGQPNNPPCT